MAKIRQARKEMEAETAPATAQQRQESANNVRAKAEAAQQANALATEQAELNKKAEAAAAKAKAAREKAIEAAEHAGLEPLDLEPVAADAMLRLGLARKADVIPTAKTQRSFKNCQMSIRLVGCVNQGLFHCWITEGVPLLQQVDPQHDRQRVWRTHSLLSGLGVDGIDQANQRVPRDHGLHLRQELLALGLLLGGRLLVIREAELLAAHQLSPGLSSQGHSRADRPGYPECT